MFSADLDSVLKMQNMCLLDMKLFSTSRTFRLSSGSMYFFSFSCGGQRSASFEGFFFLSHVKGAVRFWNSGYTWRKEKGKRQKGGGMGGEWEVRVGKGSRRKRMGAHVEVITAWVKAQSFFTVRAGSKRLVLWRWRWGHSPMLKPRRSRWGAATKKSGRRQPPPSLWLWTSHFIPAYLS